MNKVFIVQETMKRDRSTGELVRAFDLTPAAVYGELITLFKHRGSVALNTDPMVTQMKKAMKDFSDDDCLLAVGDPTAIAAAVMVASKINYAKVNLLKWDRESRNYIKVTVTV